MRHGTVLALVVASVALSGCSGGGRSIGEPCDRHGDCDGSLQCAENTCVPRCQRAPECGDGYSCASDGICHVATGQPGDACRSEVECAPGLKCQIDGADVDDNGRLRASCAAQNRGRPAGATCVADVDCRNGTCALGQCSDLCVETRDCAAGNTCMTVPRVEADGALFGGCLPSQGAIAWKIPVLAPTANVLLPVPSGARYASLVMTVDDETERVGALSVFAPSGLRLYRPCGAIDTQVCDPQDSLAQFYDNKVRHQPGVEMSVLSIPSTPNVELETGAYRIRVSSIRPLGSPGSTIPNVDAVVRIDAGALLDLHFYFLDLEDHPCEAAFGGTKLAKESAQTEAFFQSDFLGDLRRIFAVGGIALGTITFDDVTDRADLDGIDAADAGSLLALGSHADGINVFFVRTLSPVGLQAYGPSPGPAGLANTRQSGIVIGVDTLCYRSWQQLARLTAHELARYMGLYHNVEIGVGANPSWRDTILDSDDSPNNLMFYSELGGAELSSGQRDILNRSPVLR